MVRKNGRVKRVLPDETKEERFVRICSSRMSRVLTAMDSLKHLSSYYYGYDQSQVDEIASALIDAVDEIIQNLEISLNSHSGKGDVTKIKFSFSDKDKIKNES